MVRPETGKDVGGVQTGSGALGYRYDYLQQLDPISYNYERLKSKGVTELNDKMWSIAATRGESYALIDMLSEHAKLTNEQKGIAYKDYLATGGSSDASTEELYKEGVNLLSKWEDYQTDDYDSYMTALSIPLLDDETKLSERTDVTYSDETLERFGDLTERQYAITMLDNYFKAIDAQAIQEWKSEHAFWSAIGDSFVSIAGHLAAGLAEAASDLWNIVEGVGSMIGNAVGDLFGAEDAIANPGEAFLWAFQNDDIFQDLTDNLKQDMYEFDRRYCLYYNAETEQYDGFGKVITGSMDAIGYMLPSIVLTGGASLAAQAGSKAASIAGKTLAKATIKPLTRKAISKEGQALFYGQFFSGNITDTVSQAMNNGLSYKDLEAGEVISNAALKAGLQWAIEYAVGKLFGFFTTTDKLLGIGTAATRSGIKIAESEGAAFGMRALKAAKESATEGVEEVLQNFSDSFVDYAFSTMQSNLSEVYEGRALENISMQNIVDAFVIGAVTNVILGGVTDLKYIAPRNRVIGSTENGSPVQFGMYRSMNIREAMQTMQSWNNILNDASTSANLKASTAMKMSAAIHTIGSVFKSMGQERTIAANNILLGYINDEAKKEEVAKLSDANYATALYNTFKNEYANIAKKYVTQQTEEKIKKAIKAKEELLKDNKTTKIESVITDKTKTDDDELELSEKVAQISKEALEKFKASAIVGTNSPVVTKHEDVIIADNRLIETGNLGDLVQGLAYELVNDVVLDNLDEKQKKLLLSAYAKAVGQQGTIEDAIKALLFDTTFYTQMLINTHKPEMKATLDLFIAIDQLAKDALKGEKTLDKQKAKELLTRIRETMKEGIIQYATKYAYLDTSYLSPELEKELSLVTNKSPNVIYTKFINAGFTKDAISKEHFNRLKSLINILINNGMPSNEGLTLLKKSQSENANERLDAHMTIDLYIRNLDTSEKLVYLPMSDRSFTVVDDMYLAATTELLGNSIQSVINGTYDPNKLSEQAKALITGNRVRYDMSLDRCRLLLVDDILGNISHNTLTVDMNGQFAKIIDGTHFFKDRYQGKHGEENLSADLRDGKITKIGDLTNIKTEVADAPISYSNTYNQSANAFVLNDAIFVYRNATREHLLHEVTHIQQNSAAKYAVEPDTNYIKGGSDKQWSYLSAKDRADLKDYLAKEFPLLSAAFAKLKAQDSELLYWLYTGELRARATMLSSIFDIGFTFANNETTLVAPDKSKTWNITPKTSVIVPTKKQANKTKPNTTALKYNVEEQSIVDYAENKTGIKGMNYADKILSTLKTSAPAERDTEIHDAAIEYYEDKVKELKEKFGTKQESKTLKREQLPLSKETEQQLDEYVKTIDKKVVNDTVDYINKTTLYKGDAHAGITHFDNTLGEKKRTVKDSIWMTDYKEMARSYAPERQPDATIYSMDVTIKNPLVFDAEGRGFASVMPGIITDDLAVYAYNKGYDSVIIYNVVDYSTYGRPRGALRPATDIVLFSNDNIDELSEENVSLVATKQESRTLKGTTTKTKRAPAKTLKGRVYVPNKEAKESNLKYFMHKGKPIIMHTGLKNFIVSTTKDFSKLSATLQHKIVNGTLTYNDLLNFIGTASNMNDYTFNALAKYAFGNKELAKLTFKDFVKIKDELQELSAIAYATSTLDVPTKVMKPDDMIKLLPEIGKRIDTETEELEKQYDAATTQTEKDKITKKLKAAKTRWEKAQYKSSHLTILSPDGKKASIEVIPEPKTLNLVVFNNYDGTLNSLRRINNIAKVIAFKLNPTEYIENLDTSKYEGKSTNWVLGVKTAEVDYEEVNKDLSAIDKVDKLNVIEEFLTARTIEAVNKLPENVRRTQGIALQEKLEATLTKITNASEEIINQKYLLALQAEVSQKQKDVAKITEMPEAPDIKKEPATTKNLKDQIRNLGRSIKELIAGRKTRYNQLSDDVKKFIDPTTKTLNSEYRNLSDNDLSDLIANLKADRDKLKHYISSAERKAIRKEVTKEVTETMERKYKRRAEKLDKQAKKENDKTATPEYTIKIKEQTYYNKYKANSLVEKLLKNPWTQMKMSSVKDMSGNEKEFVANAKEFYAKNKDALMEAPLQDIIDACNWFMNAETKATAITYKNFVAIQAYFLSFVVGQTREGGAYYTASQEFKDSVNDYLRSLFTTGGLLLAIKANVADVLDPFKAMRQESMIIDGVEIDGALKEGLFKAVESNDIKVIKQAQQNIIKYVEEHRTKRRGIVRKLTSFRAMAMLSSPLTWLRNKVSNIVVKRINKWSTSLGNMLFKGKAKEGKIAQYTLKEKASEEAKAFVQKEFIDSGLFNTLVNNITKYNPSDIRQGIKNVAGKASKETILAQLVTESIYGEYYNKSTFDNNKFLNSAHMALMKVMSDDPYIREATVRYFGQMITERQRNLDNGVTDEIMNDFASAFGLALSDYMHQENMFSRFEKLANEKSDLGWFAYKILLPFAATSWNWFKGAIRLSPIGLARSIVNSVRLEKRIKKVQEKWEKGDSQISGELVEYITKRELGQGVIGTILWGVGLLLAGLGFIKLDDDDYGIPKLQIGKLTIDVSSIFGSSSLLAGAALVTGFNEKGLDWDGFMEGLNRAAEVTIDGFPLLQVLEMDMYSDGYWDIGVEQLESIAISFIPNILGWIAGGTYTGNVNKNTFWARAAAKIPFLGNALPKKVNPYTGEMGTWWDAFNRVVPYFSYDAASFVEETSKGLGMTKKQLRGSYTINDKEFKVTGFDLQNVNQLYGQWNAEDLEKFYSNQMSVRIKVGTKYKTLKFNQMDDKQRKTAVQTIMSNNAELSKIYAWTMKGNKYYATDNMYATLRAKGIKSNIYKGTKGFVEK